MLCILLLNFFNLEFKIVFQNVFALFRVEDGGKIICQNKS
jgi:hypothetical protein